MARVMRNLLESGNPAGVIEGVVDDGARAEATAFERYAADVLRGAGGLRLKTVSQVRAIKLIAPENGRLAKLIMPGGLPKSLYATVLSTECALNRLICIADAITDGICDNDPPEDGPRRSISILGGGFLSTNAGWRSTRVHLPHISSPVEVTPAYYNEVDWRATDCVAGNARAIFQHCIRPNAYRTTLGVHVDTQSDWDVRTRLAQIVGALELPYRCSFRFDYDAGSKSVAAVFTCPPVGFLPTISADNGNGGAQPSMSRAYEAYLLRLACLFGAACFGSGKAIETASVAGYDASWSRALVAARFGRDAFARSVLAAVDNGTFSDASLRYDPDSVAGMVEASHLDWFGHEESHGIHEVALPDMDVRGAWPAPHLDERPLPDDARKLFRCNRVCDVDTASYFGGHADAVDLARRDVADSPMAAILRLESLVEELEAQTRPPSDDTEARPLYAPNPLSRLAVGLLDDELSIASQAEAFLGETAEGLAAGAFSERAEKRFPRGGDAPSYFRAPSALFHARIGLSDLYQSLGDYGSAVLQADRCIVLAPTTAGAYYRKADVLAERGYYTQAANVLIAGLHYAVASADCALLYYHLAMLLWHLGKQRESATVHVYCSSLQGEHADRSARIVKALRGRDDAPETVHLAPFSAARELERMRLPVAPQNLNAQVAQATITLANAGSPLAAAPYARELERCCNNDEIVIAACRSIRFGISLERNANRNAQNFTDGK